MVHVQLLAGRDRFDCTTTNQSLCLTLSPSYQCNHTYMAVMVFLWLHTCLCSINIIGAEEVVNYSTV